MRSKYHGISVLLIFGFIALILTSCVTSQEEKPLNIPTEAKVTVTSITHKPNSAVGLPSSTPIPTPALDQPSPTLTTFQRQVLYDVLADETCQPPCYLGIIPGKTTFSEADSTLKSMGGENYIAYHKDHQGKTYSRYDYVFKIYEALGHVQQEIELFVYSGIIIEMRISLWSPLDQVFYAHWLQYSPLNLFECYGLPDAIYASNNHIDGNDIWIVYTAEGVLLWNGGIAREDDLICPGFKDTITTWVYMKLVDIQSPGALTAVEQLWGNGGQDWATIDSKVVQPIEAIIGIGPNEFYNQMIVDPDTCFERAINQP